MFLLRIRYFNLLPRKCYVVAQCVSIIVISANGFYLDRVSSDRGLAGTKRSTIFILELPHFAPRLETSLSLSDEGRSPSTYILYGTLIFSMNSVDFLGDT